MISVISVVSGPTLRSRVRRHDHYGEWYGSEQDVLSLTLLTTLTVSAVRSGVVGILRALGSSGGGRHAGSEERVFPVFTTRLPGGAAHQSDLCLIARWRGVANGRERRGARNRAQPVVSVCFHWVLRRPLGG